MDVEASEPAIDAVSERDKDVAEKETGEVEDEIQGEADDDEADDEEDEDDDEEYAFWFKSGTNPLDFVGDDSSGVQLDQQFERLEYEALAEEKPENPLINLCIGTALINLSLGFRLKNKHQTIAQGLAFLYNNLRLCENSQEALYNIARACYDVRLVTLAASYYEKVLQTPEKDHPIPKLPN